MATIKRVKTFQHNELILPDQPHHDDFLKTMFKVFLWSRYFGVMGPGSRIWKLWSIGLFITLIAIECGAIWKVIKALAGIAVDTARHRSVTARLAGTMFYTTAIVSLILSSRLFFGWKELQTYWVSIERAVAINIPTDLTLKKRMMSVVVIMAVCSSFEHAMSVLAVIGFDCPPHQLLRRYTLRSHGFLFLRNEYFVWMAIPLLLISNLATALWNFQDAVVILLCMGLTSRYIRLNTYVANVCANENKEFKSNLNTDAVKVYTWRKIREAFVNQAKLVRKVDASLGLIILMSSFGNFYFICLQIFLGITKVLYKPWPQPGFDGITYMCLGFASVHINTFVRLCLRAAAITQLLYKQGIFGSNVLKLSYYLVSLAWLCIRFTWMVLAAADINVESRKALPYLFNCHSRCYNVEIERLQNQLRKDYVAVSGLGFFTINRNILLKMAGAIVTYELVLIQFDNKGTADH